MFEHEAEFPSNQSKATKKIVKIGEEVLEFEYRTFNFQI